MDGIYSQDTSQTVMALHTLLSNITVLMSSSSSGTVRQLVFIFRSPFCILNLTMPVSSPFDLTSDLKSPPIHIHILD